MYYIRGTSLFCVAKTRNEWEWMVRWGYRFTSLWINNYCMQQRKNKIVVFILYLNILFWHAITPAYVGLSILYYYYIRILSSWFSLCYCYVIFAIRKFIKGIFFVHKKDYSLPLILCFVIIENTQWVCPLLIHCTFCLIEDGV